MRFRSKARNRKIRNPKARNRGFTLIEMMVVIIMIAILISIAVPMYQRSILRSREATLHQNLTTLNKAIEEYSLDKKRAPQSLEDLVPGYVKFIPQDITGRTDTWVVEPEDSENPMDPNQTGIGGVHSGSDEPSSGGDPYSSWKH